MTRAATTLARARRPAERRRGPAPRGGRERPLV